MSFNTDTESDASGECIDAEKTPIQVVRGMVAGRSVLCDGAGTPVEGVLNAAETAGVDRDDAEDALENLREQGAVQDLDGGRVGDGDMDPATTEAADEYLPDDADEIRERLLDLETEVFGYNPREDREARDANRKVKRVVAFIGNEREDDAAPTSEVFAVASAIGLDTDDTKQAIESLRKFGEIYEPDVHQLRVTA